MTGKEDAENNHVDGSVCHKVQPIKPKQLFGQRHVQVLLSFFLLFIAYGLRVNLSVAIVAMTDRNASRNPDVPTFSDWNDKSVVLSSFFWGYLLPQTVAGQLSKKYGPKWFLAASMLLCAVFTLLIPVTAIHWGSNGVMACRILQGVGQGFIFPMTHDTISRWVPSCERSRLGTYVYAGGSLGTVISMVVTGLISESWWGWPGVFYVYGCISLLWVILLVIFGADSPTKHRSISEEEKNYILGDLLHSESEIPTPWKAIFTSKAVWALIITHCGQNWGFWTLMTEIPTYMGNVMKFNITSNSTLSALPYLTLWILSFAFGGLCDLMINRNILSIGWTRKLSNSIGMFIPAISLIFLSFMTADQRNLAVALLIIAVGTNGAIYSGFHVNHIDLSPNHCGVLMGITNGLSNVFALIAPLFVQIIVTNETDPVQWRIVFGVAAGVYIVCNTIYIVFGTGELQPWNDLHEVKANGTHSLPKEKEDTRMLENSVPIKKEELNEVEIS